MEEAKTKTDIRYVGVKENLAYGFANAGQVFGYNLVAGGYLSLFFTKVFGIPEEAVATMILILGIWDTINDPLMGSIIDKTRTRYGKLRPYLMLVPIPLSIATIMLFAGPEILADAKTTTVKNRLYVHILFYMGIFLYNRRCSLLGYEHGYFSEPVRQNKGNILCKTYFGRPRRTFNNCSCCYDGFFKQGRLEFKAFAGFPHSCNYCRNGRYGTLFSCRL